MKKYKHRITGDVVTEISGNGPLAKYKNDCGYYITAKYIENTQDWEEIKPFFTTWDGVDIEEGTLVHWVGNKDYSPPQYFYRLSFEIGHKSYDDWDKEDSRYKVFSTEKAAKAYIYSKTPRLLYTTEDGVGIYDQREYSGLWGVGLQCTSENILKQGYHQNTINSTPSTNRKWFAFQANAEEYIRRNYKKYSLVDIEDKLGNIASWFWGREMSQDVKRLEKALIKALNETNK